MIYGYSPNYLAHWSNHPFYLYSNTTGSGKPCLIKGYDGWGKDFSDKWEDIYGKGEYIYSKGDDNNCKGDDNNCKGDDNNRKGDDNNRKGDDNNRKGDDNNSKGKSFYSRSLDLCFRYESDLPQLYLYLQLR